MKRAAAIFDLQVVLNLPHHVVYAQLGDLVHAVVFQAVLLQDVFFKVVDLSQADSGDVSRVQLVALRQPVEAGYFVRVEEAHQKGEGLAVEVLGLRAFRGVEVCVGVYHDYF